MAEPAYDVFSGTPDRSPLWLEAASTLEEACERMKARARAAPGQYFVYCFASHTVLALADTRPGASADTDGTNARPVERQPGTPASPRPK